MKTYEFRTITGKEIKLEINYSKELVEVKNNYDGLIVVKNEIEEVAEIKAYVDGKNIGTGNYLHVSSIKNSAYEGKVPAEITHFVTINNKPITLTAEQANELNKIFNELKSENTTEEVKVIENAEDIEEAKEIVKLAEKQETIPTYEQARQIEENYNNIHNEGKEGFVPHIVDKSEYNWALKILNKNKVCG